MSLYSVAALLLVVSLASLGQGLKHKKDLPIFVKTMQELHRGPPKQLIISRAAVRTRWITQKLDNFDEANEHTYQMRYFVNDEFQTEGSPIIIFLGGEWEAEPSMIKGGILYDLAKENKGVLVYTEHRYYGESVPTPDMSKENLQYLSVRQALADVAHFIREFKAGSHQLSNSKVLLCGGSYSGSMVVWFKHLYPELLVGGWASSAPLLAQLDFVEYREMIGKNWRELGSQQCYDKIQDGFAGLEELFDSGRVAEARAMLHLCSNFDEQNDLDMWTLFSTIANSLSGMIQNQRGTEVVDYWCDYFEGYDDATAALAYYFHHYAWGGPTCIDSRYSEIIEFYKDSMEYFNTALPWYYQTCNEFGWFQSSGSRNQPFGRKFPATMNIETCKELFGREYGNEGISQNIANINAQFGGMDIDVQNIYMTQGSMDPWSPMGHGVEQGAVVITNASHCNDFSSISASDSAEMRASKERLFELVREWLA